MFRLFRRFQSGLTPGTVAIIGAVADTAEGLTQQPSPQHGSDAPDTGKIFAQTAAGVLFCALVLGCCIYAWRQCCRQPVEVDEETARINSRTSVREADQRSGIYP